MLRWTVLLGIHNLGVDPGRQTFSGRLRCTQAAPTIPVFFSVAGVIRAILATTCAYTRGICHRVCQARRASAGAPVFFGQTSLRSSCPYDKISLNQIIPTGCLKRFHNFLNLPHLVAPANQNRVRCIHHNQILQPGTGNQFLTPHHQ